MAPGYGTSALNAYDIGGTFTHNSGGRVGGPVSQSGNFFPSSIDQVGFVNYAGGDYSLASNSPYKNAGTDSKDLGANLTSNTASVVPPPAVLRPPLSIRIRRPLLPLQQPDVLRTFGVGDSRLEKQRQMSGRCRHIYDRSDPLAAVGLLGRRQPEIPVYCRLGRL